MEFGGSTAAGALYLDTFAGDSDGGRAEEFVRTFENAVGRLPEDVDAEAFDLLWMRGKLGQGVRDKTIAQRRLAVVSKLPYRNPWGGVTGDFLFGPDGAPLREFNIYRFDSNGEVSPAF